MPQLHIWPNRSSWCAFSVLPYDIEAAGTVTDDVGMPLILQSGALIARQVRGDRGARAIEDTVEDVPLIVLPRAPRDCETAVGQRRYRHVAGLNVSRRIL